MLPTKRNSGSSLSSSSTSNESISGSSSSEVEFANIKSDGQFGNLRKDDDLLSMRRQKKKKKCSFKKKKKSLNLGRDDGNISTSKANNYDKARRGGKQTVGFIYNRAWHKEMERVFFEKSTSIKKNGVPIELNQLNEGIVREPVNAGWWLFSFNGGKVASRSQFKFKTSLPVHVTLVDLFCRGDSFSIWDEGKLIAQSSRIRGDAECGEVMFGPQEALADGRWSSVVFELEQGDHSIEIKTVDSVLESGGIAAIKFDHILINGIKGGRVSRNKVCRGYNGLIVVDNLVAGSDAESVCVGLKTDLATMKLDDEATLKSIKTCLGTGKKVWAFNRDEFEVGTLEVVVSGENGGKLGLKEDADDDDIKAVLCRVRS